MSYYLHGVFAIANMVLSLFVLWFAFSFLKRTSGGKDRNPWFFMLFAVVIFFVMQVINVLHLFGITDFTTYRIYFDSMFLAIILFTFVFQYNLILNSELILIAGKTAGRKAHDEVSDELESLGK